jgi:phage baseplate assembly protein gpV
MKVEIRRGRVVAFNRVTQVVRIQLGVGQGLNEREIEIHSSSYYGVGTESAPSIGDEVEVILDGGQSEIAPLSARAIRAKVAV